MLSNEQLRRQLADALPAAIVQAGTDVSERLRGVQREAAERGIFGNPLARLIHLLGDHPTRSRLEALAGDAAREAGEDGERASLLFLLAVFKEPTLIPDVYEAIFRALYLLGPAQVTAGVRLDIIAERLRGVFPSGDDTFADDLEEIQRSQPRTGPRP